MRARKPWRPEVRWRAGEGAMEQVLSERMLRPVGSDRAPRVPQAAHHTRIAADGTSGEKRRRARMTAEVADCDGAVAMALGACAVIGFIAALAWPLA